jgi:hypothetical protein
MSGLARLAKRDVGLRTGSKMDTVGNSHRKEISHLEKLLENEYLRLKGELDAFQKKCLELIAQKNVSSGTLLDIQEVYEHIRNRVNEVRALEKERRQKVASIGNAGPPWEKKLAELESAVEAAYARFETAVPSLKEDEFLGRRGEKAEEEAAGDTDRLASFSWFRSRENQEIFLRNVQTLGDFRGDPFQGAGDRRNGASLRSPNGQSMTLFVFAGDGQSLDELQSQIQLRERDILERYSREELRGVLIHSRGVVDPSEMESILRRFLKKSLFSQLKCLLVRIQAQSDLRAEVFDLIQQSLQEMTEGEIKNLSV